MVTYVMTKVRLRIKAFFSNIFIKPQFLIQMTFRIHQLQSLQVKLQIQENFWITRKKQTPFKCMEKTPLDITLPWNQTVLTLTEREQEQIKQRNRIKLERQRKHNRLLQLKQMCRCAYGFCQGLQLVRTYVRILKQSFFFRTSEYMQGNAQP